MSDEDIRRYTADELRAMVARGESKSDWQRVDSMTEAELEAAIADDPDWKDIPANWYENAIPAGPKQQVTLRLDPDILAHFRGEGRFWQTRMNAVLRAYVTAAKSRRAG